jgi:4-hydroxy-4-methyl-2-oxoglutarate aldolase
MAKVIATIERPPKALVDRFRPIRLEILVQLLTGEGLMDSAIKPLAQQNWRIVGPALTVAPAGTDTMAGIMSVGLAQAGDVVVVAAQGDCSAGCWGGGLTLSAEHVGCEGVVVDGAVLDGRMILQRPVPVFCRTSTARHVVGNIPGSINVDVTCGGVPVQPGDLIVGELDGVIVVPRASMEALIGPAEEKNRRLEEAGRTLKESRGTLFDLRGGRAMLEAKGVEWID